MTLPFEEPLVRKAPGPRVIPEPPRSGEAGGPPCRICTGRDEPDEHEIWRDEHWVLRVPGQTSLPGTVWLATWAHHDSFADLPCELAREYGPLAGRIERAILSLGDVGRVHVYRWGDGVAHFHIWFIPRPLGMMEATRHTLTLWEDVLPPASLEEIAAAGRHIAAALTRPPAEVGAGLP